MKTKKRIIYEVIYTEGGYQYQTLTYGKQEAKALHKAHPGSTFRACSSMSNI